MEDTDFSALRKTELFRQMSTEETWQALGALTWYIRNYQKGELVLMAGNTTESTGLVLSGSVTIESSDVWGNRTVLSHVGSGYFFAETYATLPGEVLLVDVTANEASRILFIRTGRLPALLATEKSPWIQKLTGNMLRISMRKNLMLSGRSFHTAPKSARGRIMSYLTSVSLRKNAREFDIPFDRQQMADYLNLDRTALSKELGKMRDDGIISFHKNHFRLLSE